jgi:integral membrane protein
MIRIFRGIALIEGITTLLLFGLAVPAKYVFAFPALTPPIGWAHGIAFLAYLVTMTVALWGKGAGVTGWTRTVLAAFVPFGTFANDKYVARFA